MYAGFAPSTRRHRTDTQKKLFATTQSESDFCSFLGESKLPGLLFPDHQQLLPWQRQLGQIEAIMPADKRMETEPELRYTPATTITRILASFLKSHLKKKNAFASRLSC